MKSVKKILLALALCSAVTLCSAQQYAQDYVVNKNGKPSRQIEMIYGALIGVDIPDMADRSGYNQINNSAGVRVGLMWGVDLGSVEFIPELWYIHNTATITNPISALSGDIITNSIEVPLLFQVPFAKVVRFNVGPSFSLMSDSKIAIEGQTEELLFGRMKSTCGYVIGLSGLINEHFIVDARFTGRFVTTANASLGDISAVEQHDYRYYSFAVNVGYRF